VSKRRKNPESSSGDSEIKKKPDTRADESEIRADESEIRANVSELRADESETRADISEHRADRSEGRANRSETRADKIESKVEEAEQGFGDLIEELKGVRSDLKDTNKELARVKRSKVRDRVVFGLVAILAGWIMFNNYDNNKDNKNTLNAVKAQGIAGVVSNCAFTNIQSGNITELLTDFERDRIISKELGDKERARFQRINCVGLVSESGEELNICLQYPSLTDPDTGQPIPTTTTPQEKVACDKAAESQRKAIEEQEKKLREGRQSQ
jgi:hypothetical protein